MDTRVERRLLGRSPAIPAHLHAGSSAYTRAAPYQRVIAAGRSFRRPPLVRRSALQAESLRYSGVSTGANQPLDLEGATRFCVEAAKAFGAGKCQFYDPSEFEKLVSLYGPMTHLQTAGRVQPAFPDEV